MTSLRTWGEGVDYTTNTRPTWRNGRGRKTALINCGHFTRLRGRSFPLNKVNNPNVQQACIELEEEGFCDATINRVISAVSTVMNHLAFDGIIEAAPKLRRRKELEHRMTWYTKDEVERLAYASLDPFQRRDLHDIILAAAYTGCRQGELMSIKCSDIDLGSNLIHIGGKPDFITKAGNYRSVPIHERIKDLVCVRMEHATPNTKLFGSDWTDKDQLIRAFRKVRTFIGKDDTYVFHTLRHSFCTWCIEANVPLVTVKELAGHKRIETTLRYTKVSDKARTDAMALI